MTLIKPQQLPTNLNAFPSVANLTVVPMIRATQQPLDVARVRALVASGTPLDPLAAIGLYESGNDYNVGVGGVDLSNASLSALGFPIWSGTGNSHAAGRGQVEPGTWNPAARILGIWDFLPESQDAVMAYLYNTQGFAPWEPYDAPLAAYIASVGGPAAFYQPGSLPIRLAAAL
jgi:hypothetical protein